MHSILFVYGTSSKSVYGFEEYAETVKQNHQTLLVADVNHFVLMVCVCFVHNIHSLSESRICESCWTGIFLLL